LHNAASIDPDGGFHGSSQKEEEIQRNQSSEINGARRHRHASASAKNSHAQGIAERFQAQTHFGKIAFGGVGSESFLVSHENQLPTISPGEAKKLGT
jgi:hypothetical protein